MSERSSRGSVSTTGRRHVDGLQRSRRRCGASDDDDADPPPTPSSDGLLSTAAELPCPPTARSDGRSVKSPIDSGRGAEHFPPPPPPPLSWLDAQG